MESGIGTRLLSCILGWGVSLLLAFPLLWMILTAFKTEAQAIAAPPLPVFTPTLENFAFVLDNSNYPHFFLNSVITSVGSTLLGLLVALPAAYSLAFFPSRRTKDILVWMLSTGVARADSVTAHGFLPSIPPMPGSADKIIE